MTPTSPGSSQRAMDVVFASLVSQLQPELREALISSGLDDPGLLRAYPRSPVEDLRAMGLGMAMGSAHFCESGGDSQIPIEIRCQ